MKCETINCNTDAFCLIYWNERSFRVCAPCAQDALMEGWAIEGPHMPKTEENHAEEFTIKFHG